MNYCRFLLNSQVHYGSVEDIGGELWIAGPAPAPPEDLAYRLALEQGEIKNFDFPPMLLSAADLLPPVTPSKIMCVGRNYREHVRELGNELPAEPLLFFKPPSSLLACGGTVRLPVLSTRVDFEGELALVIARRVRKLAPEHNWRDVVRGFTLANDISARDLQKKDVQWTRAKGFDTFCPVGPVVSDEIDLDSGLTIETRLNGEVRQHATTADFIFSVQVLLSAITAAITLEAGDLVLTGTPSGVGPLAAGDRVEVSMAGLGVLANRVEAD
ncbi:MAG TPA: fumarylacetoacetate hydrolase family protein [Terracidiphilus sp.]|jgi:2-keto-4-pentenoate hydratase/2-oxohepta-3-ene-1,7-dioic acid hydratase in catechol pathway